MRVYCAADYYHASRVAANIISAQVIMKPDCVLLVSGESKKEIVKRAFLGPITPEVPASVLQLHNDVILVGDEAALADYYEAVR